MAEPLGDVGRIRCPSAVRPADDIELRHELGDALDDATLPVQFAFDSAEILPSARSQLDALAEGIRMLPAVQAVVIEGHTDAIGSDAYNETLSLRRAYAVKSYLVASHRIDPTRLHAVGLGKFQPLPGRDPQAPENRRVQFRGE